MIISCGHKCQKSLNECLQCLRNQIENRGVHNDERIRVRNAWGYEV